MAAMSFQVNNYVLQTGYKSSATWGGTKILSQGFVACHGLGNQSLIIYGLHPSSPVPPAPVYNVPAKSGAIFVPFSDLPSYVDIVRNEKPIYARLDSDHPEWMCLSTSREPVGEGE